MNGVSGSSPGSSPGSWAPLRPSRSSGSTPARLARFKAPRELIVVDALPRTPPGSSARVLRASHRPEMKKARAREGFARAFRSPGGHRGGGGPQEGSMASHPKLRHLSVVLHTRARVIAS